MSKIALATALVALAANDMNGGRREFKDFLYRPKREPKNKYNLTPEQLEKMADMTPKEKKAYLKTLNKMER